MKDTTINEIVEEFDKDFKVWQWGGWRFGIPGETQFATAWIKKRLRNNLQSYGKQREEAIRESERESIRKMIEELPAFTCCSEKSMGQVSDEAKKPTYGTNYLERETILQSLKKK